MSYFKNVMIVLPLLFSLLSLQVSFVSANSLTACPGAPTTLHWWSGNVDNCSISVTGTTNGVLDAAPTEECNFRPTINVELSSTVELRENQACSVIFTCSPADPVSADLTVVNAPPCCGTFDNITNTFWEPTINNCVLPLSVGVPTPTPSKNILPNTQFTVTFPIINGGAQATRTVVLDAGSSVSTTAGGSGTTCQLLDSTQSVVLETVSCNGPTGSITSNTPDTVTGNDYGYFIRVNKGGQSVTSSMFTVSAYPKTEVTISQSRPESVVSDTSGAYTISWTSFPTQNRFGRPDSCEIRKTDSSGTVLWTGLTDLNEFDGSAVEIAERLGDQHFVITCDGPGGVATAELHHTATPPLGITKPADQLIVLPTLDFSVSVSLTNNAPIFGIEGATCTLLDYTGADTLGPDATFPCSTNSIFPWQLDNGAAAGTYGFFLRAVKGSQTVRSAKFIVTAVPHTSVRLNQSPTTILGEEYSIGWTTTGAPTSCILTKPDGTSQSVSTNNKDNRIVETQSVVGDYTYSILCDGPGLIDTDSITHRVDPIPVVPTCGSASQTNPPLLFIPNESVRNDPSTVAPADFSNSNSYNPKSLCANGTYLNTPSDTKNNNDYTMSWNWSCEGIDGNTSVVSCSVPNWGCTDVNNKNYKPNGPNNTYACSSQCEFGFNWDTSKQACVPAPRTVANLSQTSTETAIGGAYRIEWSSFGDNPTTCTIRRSIKTTGDFVEDSAVWSTSRSGEVTERPTVDGVYKYLLECNGPGGPASKTVDHVVAKTLGITAPPNQVLIYPKTSFTAVSTIINGGLGAKCKLVSPKAGDDTLGGVEVPCEGSIASVAGNYSVGNLTTFPVYPQYRISVTKGSQTAVSPLFTITIVSPADVSLTQSSLASVVNTTYDVRWTASSTLTSCTLNESLRPVSGTNFVPQSSLVVGVTGNVFRTPKTGEEGTRRFNIACKGLHGETANKTIDHTIDPRVAVSTPPDQTIIQTGGIPNTTFTATFSITNGGGGTTCALADGNGNEISGTSRACTGSTGSITYTIPTNDIDYQYRILVKKPSQNISSGAFKVRLRPPTTVTFSQSSSVTVVNSPFTLSWNATPAVPLTSFDPRTTCTLAKGIGAGPDSVVAIPIKDTQEETPKVAGDYRYTVTCDGVGGTVVSSLNHRVNDGLSIAPIATTTIVLPTTAFSVRAYIANGGANTTCRLLDYQGTPIAGTSVDCSSPLASTNGVLLSGNTGTGPTSYLFFVEAKNGGQTVTQRFIVKTLAKTAVTLSHVAATTVTNEQYRVVWTTVGDPDSCRLTKPSASPQAVDTRGGEILESKTTQGDYTYSITCEGPGGTDSGSISHRVNNPPLVDSCGTLSTDGRPIASEIEFSTSSVQSLCASGAYIANTPADTVNAANYVMTWRWSCGTAATSCSAPNYGCTDPNDINYVENRPNNKYGCANKCKPGYIFDTVNTICVEAPKITITLNQTSPSSTLGNRYTLFWSVTGNPDSCAINTTGPASSFTYVNAITSLEFNPVTTGTYTHTLTCTKVASDPVSSTISHDVYLPLSLTTPSSLTALYSTPASASFQINFDILNGGTETTCTLLDYLGRTIPEVAPFPCTSTGGTDTLYTVNTGLDSFGGSNGYYVLAQKGTQVATSSKFTLTVNPVITTFLSQSTSTTIANDPGYIITWSSTPIKGSFGAPESCNLVKRSNIFGSGLGFTLGEVYATSSFDSVIERPQLQGTYHFRLTCSGPGGVSTKEFYHDVLGALTVPTPANQTQIYPNTTFTIPLTIQNGGPTTKCTLLDYQGKSISEPQLCEGGTKNITVDAPPSASGGIYGYKILIQKGSQSVTTETFSVTVNPVITVTISQSTPATFIGMPFTLSWNSTPEQNIGFGKPTTCSITKSADIGGGFGSPAVWSTNVFKSDNPVTETIGIVGSYRYVFSCTGPGGTATKEVIHTVNENDTCGVVSSPDVPLESETLLAASSTGISQLCISGIYSNNQDITTSKLQKWVWSCGGASCSAPKYGCTALHNKNYDANGPQNKYNCSSTCDYGYNWNTTTLTCDPAPDTTVSISQSSSSTIVGVPYTVTWGSGGSPESCSITRTQSDGSVQNNWATGFGGEKVETPTGSITYQDFTITCNGPGGSKSASIHHIVAPVLSISTPPNQTITLPNTTVNATFIVTNGGVGTTCKVVDYNDAQVTVASPCIGTGGTSPYTVTLTYNTPPTASAIPYGYKIVVAKADQTATSQKFNITVDPTPVCGSSDNVPSQNQPPNNAQSCSEGDLVVTGETLTSGLQAWNWTCGGAVSCSAPKFGCRITTDSNFDLPQYGLTGPNNDAGCANTCENGSVEASYPGCNECTSPLVYDPTATGNQCVAPLSVVATGETSMVLPETDFTLNYSITNGTGNSTTQCRLVGTNGFNVTPVSGSSGVYGDCSGSLSGEIPSTLVSTSTGYGYYVQVKKGSQEVISNKIIITAIPVPECGDINNIPQLNVPVGGKAACEHGAFVLQSQTTTEGDQSWNWTCGGVASCSAPLFGCRIESDSNFILPQYGDTGPDNNWGCAGTCANNAVTASYPSCNACPANSVFDPTVSGNSCILPLGINTIPNQTIQAPNTTFTVSYTLVNGNENNSTCRLLGTDGEGTYFPLTESSSCDGSITFDTPDEITNGLFGGVYGYRVEVEKGSQVIQSNGFTVTVLPIAPVATFTNFMLRCDNSDRYSVTFEGKKVFSGNINSEDFEEVAVPHSKVGVYTAVCGRGSLVSQPKSLTYSGMLTLTGSPCTIPVGFASCDIPAFWTTAGVASVDFIDRNMGDVLSSSLNSPSGFRVTVHHDGTNFDLKDSSNDDFLLDTKSAFGVCVSGSEWISEWENNPVNLCLERPVLQAFTITGQFTGGGVLRLICQRSTHYEIQKETSIGSAEWVSATGGEQLYTGTVSLPVGSQSGDATNYKAKCINGPLSDGSEGKLPKFTATPITIQYKKTPPPSSVTLNAAPRTLSVGSETTLSWTINYPTSVCTIHAQPVCTGTCSEAQKLASTTINTVLKTGATDGDDPSGGSRLISSGIKNLIDDVTVFPWQSKGKKSITVFNSMDFEIKCGPGPTESAKVRVIVTGSNEG